MRAADLKAAADGAGMPAASGETVWFMTDLQVSSKLELTVSSLSEPVKLRYTLSMKWTELRQQTCPVARGLSVVGDRWTLLVLRDCFFGIRRFEQFQERLGITRHVLADRLRTLESGGLLRREAYQDRPVRHEYRLTDAGRAFFPTLVSLMDWADTHVPSETGHSVTLVSTDTGDPIRPLLVDQTSGAPVTVRNTRALAQGEPSDKAG